MFIASLNYSGEPFDKTNHSLNPGEPFSCTGMQASSGKGHIAGQGTWQVGCCVQIPSAFSHTHWRVSDPHALLPLSL